MKKGFSLVELIVVVTIIAVVSTLSVVSFSGTNKKSRDSRRTSDLEKMRLALEVAKQTGTTYPVTATALESGGFIQKLPVDPKSGSYLYQIGANNLSYTLDAQMEDLGSTNGVWGSYNYRVTNP